MPQRKFPRTLTADLIYIDEADGLGMYGVDGTTKLIALNMDQAVFLSDVQRGASGVITADQAKKIAHKTAEFTFDLILTETVGLEGGPVGRPRRGPQPAHTPEAPSAPLPRAPAPARQPRPSEGRETVHPGPRNAPEPAARAPRPPTPLADVDEQIRRLQHLRKELVEDQAVSTDDRDIVDDLKDFGLFTDPGEAKDLPFG